MYDPLAANPGESETAVRSKEFKRSADFYNKFAHSAADLHSNSKIRTLSSYGLRTFQKSRFLEAAFERYDKSKMKITEADLPNMNPVDVFELLLICERRKTRTPFLRHHYKILRGFLNAMIHDFGFIDFELHKEFPGVAPPLLEPNKSMEGLPDQEAGIISTPFKAIIYHDDKDLDQSLQVFRFSEKHLYATGFIQGLIKFLAESESVYDMKVEFITELNWMINLRRFWKKVIDFIDRTEPPKPGQP